MKCRHIRKMVADYVNEVLDPDDMHLVEEHIAKCESCRRELDTLRKVLRLIDDVKVEYPSASVWQSFIPDLHRRIETEAALAFRKQRWQRLYFLSAWGAAASVAVLVLFASLLLRHYMVPKPLEIQKTENAVVETTSQPLLEDDSESMLIANVISEVLITEEEAVELRELTDLAQPEITAISYQSYDDPLVDVRAEPRDAESDEEFIQFLLENEFAEFDDSPMMEADSGEFGAM